MSQRDRRAGESRRPKGAPRDASTASGWRWQGSPTRRTICLGVLVCAVVAAVHWPVLSAQAISMDDDPYLFANPSIMNPSWAGVGRILREVSTSSHIRGYYEPLSVISLMWDVAQGASRGNLRPFHRTNLALHLVNTFLLIVLLQALFGQPWAAAATGLLFGLHPLTVEPVAWIWERKTLLATAFVLGCLLLYAVHAKRGGSGWYLTSLLLFALALLSKPTVTPLPILLLLLDGWPLGRLEVRDRKLLSELVMEKVPFLVFAALSALITIASTAHTADVALPGEFSVASLPARISYLILFYLGKVVWPAHLSSVYVLPQPISLGTPVYLISTVCVLLLIIALVLLIRRIPALPAGICFFLIAILPTLGIVRYSWISASDKYVYFPALGLALIVCWRLSSSIQIAADTASTQPTTHKPWFSRLARRSTLVLALSVAALEAAATRQNLARWRSTESLFRSMLDLTPDVAALHMHLGWCLMDQGREAEAVAQYTEALRLNPGMADAHYNMGVYFLRRAELEAAITHLRSAVAAKPNDYAAHINLGVALARHGDLEAAAGEFDVASGLRPQSVEAHTQLGLALFRLNRFGEAVRAFRQAIALDPAHAGLLHRNLAAALVKLDEGDQAILEYQASLRLLPDGPTFRQLGDLLAARNLPKAALDAYRQALRMNPGDVEAQQKIAKLTTP